MTKGDKQVPALVHAAQTLEAELVKLEALSRLAQKIPLNSERNITRAAKELGEAAALQDGLAEGLQLIASAMAQMQVRQQGALEPLAAFAIEVQQRMQRLQEHMQAFGTLGTAAGEVTSLIQSANGDHSALVEGVDTLLAKLTEGARALAEAAHADDFPDVVREADALKQRVSALRKRLDRPS